MAPPPPEKIADIRAEQAVRAWTRRHSGSWTQDDETTLQKWLAAAPENRAAYEKVGHAWTLAGGMGGRVSREVPNRRPYGLWIAASVLAALSYPAWVMSDNWWNGARTDWTAKRGETRAIQLPDGTRVVLDSNSQIESRIGARSRLMLLKHGEALVTIAHDANRPFKVNVGPGRITDIGTRFDVESLEGKTRVSVLEGRVSVSTPQGQLLLDAGHASGYDNLGALLPVIDIDGAVTIWEAGQRHFNADRLSDVLERITRYHVVTFVFKEPELKDLRVSGTFRTDNLPLFLRTLRAALPIETVWLDPQRVQISRRTGIGSRESFAATP
jgi:transmembrane sensor